MLLVEIIIFLASVQIKLAMMFDLIPLRALLILITWKLDSLIKYFAFLMLIGVMTLKLKVSSNKTTLVLSNTREIEFLVQSSLPYILLLMVCANYCAPYPK